MDAFVKGLLQGSIPTIVLVGGTHYLVKGFKVSRPVVYWGSLLAATGLTYAVVMNKVPAPFMDAESEDIEIVDIDWETDGENVDLPSSVKVPSDLEEDEIADYLSDNYGFLVNGFVMGAENFESFSIDRDDEGKIHIENECDGCGKKFHLTQNPNIIGGERAGAIVYEYISDDEHYIPSYSPYGDLYCKTCYKEEAEEDDFQRYNRGQGQVGYDAETFGAESNVAYTVYGIDDMDDLNNMSYWMEGGYHHNKEDAIAEAKEWWDSRNTLPLDEGGGVVKVWVSKTDEEYGVVDEMEEIVSYEAETFEAENEPQEVILDEECVLCGDTLILVDDGFGQKYKNCLGESCGYVLPMNAETFEAENDTWFYYNLDRGVYRLPIIDGKIIGLMEDREYEMRTGFPNAVELLSNTKEASSKCAKLNAFPF